MDEQNLNRLIGDLGKDIGIPDLALDEDGFVCIINEDGVVVNIDHFDDQDSLVIYTTIGEIVEDRRLEIYDEMLKANFMWKDTLGATLCVSPDGKHALLMASFTVGDLDLPQLLNMYKYIYEMTWAWAGRFRAVAGEDLPERAVEGDEAQTGDDAGQTPPTPSQLA